MVGSKLCLFFLCPADIQQLIGCQQELPPQLRWGSSSLKQEDPQPPYVKEEEEEVDVNKLPLSVVSVKSEDYEDEATEWSQLHHPSPSGDHHGRPPPDNLLAPLSESDDMEQPLRSDEDCEGPALAGEIPHPGQDGSRDAGAYPS
ncbi:uncharacterized protein LOC133474770 isoform X3 [Phyllopteryx taeniolatus]|uniref:uncharacterized protein LOC133474770 isoform X3 n=1 Tax=Phyllopteryx taeniolatus TaxID=161469 RepID=UPI002AD53809|nr:uncharacterized protein LOC133474770 isoform X3 [Phyllopteryx taeniolatus]